MKTLPNYPDGIHAPSVVMHNQSLLLCGASSLSKKCFKLENGNWKKHSTLNHERCFASAVSTDKATFIFGGGGQFSPSRKTYEFLPKDSTKWKLGKIEIPEGFWDGSAVAVRSNQEIWLIGGMPNENRILSFNLRNHTFHELPTKLNIGRTEHRSAFIPGTDKIIITGGRDVTGNVLGSTEILDTEDESVTMANAMATKRCGHGIGDVTINGEDRLVIFGGLSASVGRFLNNVEVYNAQFKRFKITKARLKEERGDFGFLSVKLGDVSLM